MLGNGGTRSSEPIFGFKALGISFAYMTGKCSSKSKGSISLLQLESIYSSLNAVAPFGWSCSSYQDSMSSSSARSREWFSLDGFSFLLGQFFEKYHFFPIYKTPLAVFSSVGFPFQEFDFLLLSFFFIYEDFSLLLGGWLIVTVAILPFAFYFKVILFASLGIFCSIFENVFKENLLTA